MEIRVFGHVCIDRNISESGKRYEAPGSPAMFMHTINEQFPGSNLVIVASHGPDYLPFLQAAGAKIYPQSPNIDRTLVYENDSSSIKRTQRASNRDFALPVAIGPFVQKDLRRADIAIVAPLLPNFYPEYFSRITTFLPKGSLRFLLPQGYFRDFDSENNVIEREFKEADQVLPNIDVAIASDQDHENMLYMAKNWTKRHRDLVFVITLGERGAVAITSKGELEFPTEEVRSKDIVNSVGLGDIFSYGFARRFWETYSLEEAGRYANALARQCLFYPTDRIKIDLAAILKGSLV